MDIPIVVQARMSSKRLPGKVLRSVGGKPMIEYLLDRLKRCSEIKKIIVATSTDRSDQPIYDYCKENSVECFRGPLDNVAERFKDVIEEYGADGFIRICGDSPLVDPKLIDLGMRTFKNGNYDIVTNILECTFPKGQSFEIVRSEAFVKGFEGMKEPEDFEHVTAYFYKNSDKFKIHNIVSTNASYSQVNLAVDSIDDFNVFARILKSMNKPFLNYNWEEIAKIYEGIKKKV